MSEIFTAGMPAYAQTILPGITNDLFNAKPPLAMMDTIRHGEQKPIDSDTRITPPIFDKTHPDYTKNLKKRLDRTLSKRGRHQIRDYVVKEFWPDYLARVPDSKDRHIILGYSERMRTQSSADVADSLINGLPVIGRYEGVNPYESVRKTHIGPLNTTVVIDSVEKELYDQHIDRGSLKGPEVPFVFVKYWVNALYNEEIAEFFSNYGIPTPYELGRKLFEETLHTAFKERENAYETNQDVHLLFTHETSLYALYSYMIDQEELPLFKNGDYLRFNFYGDHVTVSFNGESLRDWYYSPIKADKTYEVERVKKKDPNYPYIQSQFAFDNLYG